jgi:hypothetical protein
MKGNILMKQYDILFLADHFVLVTTVEMAGPSSEGDIEDEAVERMATVYGVDFANVLKDCRVQITETPDK